MVKPNYSFAKRQREIAKKQKKETKRAQKVEAQEQTSTADVSNPHVEKPQE